MAVGWHPIQLRTENERLFLWYWLRNKCFRILLDAVQRWLKVASSVKNFSHDLDQALHNSHDVSRPSNIIWHSFHRAKRLVALISIPSLDGYKNRIRCATFHVTHVANTLAWCATFSPFSILFAPKKLKKCLFSQEIFCFESRIVVSTSLP